MNDHAPESSNADDRDVAESITVGAVSALPQHIGRYRVEKILGRGAFGLVYLAHDDQLQRLVAIKVPHARLVAQTAQAEAYLSEARTVANLDHPHIVPVFDVGSTDSSPCYIVAKYIDGTDLATRLAHSRMSPPDTVELIATVAEALHYAHRQGLVHRDIKPGNLLLDKQGQPFVADFGLALREREVGTGPRYAGTPAYMSPEQARGEGHRVDGRSDIYSLGVVLYEMLTGRRPFNADSQDELLKQITGEAIPPLRQIDERIPGELERICLKALSKRAIERYATAIEMASDLRHWISSPDAGRIPAEGTASTAETVIDPERKPASELQKQVFFSYASHDTEAAFGLCRLLEEQGIGCWIAPRDVPAGANYGEAIIRAIEATSTTVLMLSAHANASIHVNHEVERATSKRRRVIPVRLEDVQPGPSLELHLATTQWVDAWRSTPDQVAAQLALVLRDGGPATAVFPASGTLGGPSSDGRGIRIVPKGLRSFDAHDADFFLELLPGPRDRDGLPDSIRFWKTRIEETDADSTFSVGLIYGPSGCGKSSLVKAGLLPRLSGKVTVVYVESTGEETETRLLNGLRKQCPALSKSLSLKETLAALRQGQGVPAGRKVLIVLDQFEQWLHASHNESNTDLVQALRQCDGGRLQCIVMVRDDFWLAVSRFLRDLEIRLVEGQNSALADLFDVDHAGKVMLALGRAFGRIPAYNRDISREQQEFLQQSVTGLAQNGKVICVRLALFAEMMKGKSWTPATLKKVGGTEGVGITFLEETFSAATAPPEHRYHQKAARGVLKALLPESGTDIKGHMRSQQELLEASGYGIRRKDFDDLIRMLDSEIRLITPTDPEGKESTEELAAPIRLDQQYYQLTHDYLVPSLRDWLTRKQKETRRGRTELLLADRAAVWNARPENRQLPTLWQWLQINWLTARKSWTSPQLKMMLRARAHYGIRAVIVTAALCLLGWGGYETYGAIQARASRERLLDAGTKEVPGIVRSMEPFRRWLDPLLHVALTEAESKSDLREQLHVSLALLPVDSSQLDYLFSRLLTAQPSEVAVIREALAPHQDALRDRLWTAAFTTDRNLLPQRLRVASALAQYDPQNPQWKMLEGELSQDLVNVPSVHLATWIELLRPVRERLTAQLIAIFHDTRRRDVERSLATDILADYAADQPQVLSELLMDADSQQFSVIFPKFLDQSATGMPLLGAEIKRELPPGTEDNLVEKLARRKANAAVALSKLNQANDIWQLLRQGPDPRTRSYLIHRFAQLRADPAQLAERFHHETDIGIRRALLLSLGELAAEDVSPEVRQPLVAKVRDDFRTVVDPGLHSAAEWLLRRWNDEAWLNEVQQAWVTDKEKQSGPGRLGQTPEQVGQPSWYVNSQGQTLVVIPGPVEFLMGTPVGARDWRSDEQQHRKSIGRSFAIGATLVTKEQFLRFHPTFSHPEMKYYPTATCPMGGMIWHEAAAYCNWLSRLEGLEEDQCCYEIENGVVVRLKENYLSLPAYRLPTEAELEYATRAGATTSRFFGETEELLPKYAWYVVNSLEQTHPVGSLKPNDLGLFDVQGSLWAWCQNAFVAYPERSDTEISKDLEDELVVVGSQMRALRGGSFVVLPSRLRSAARNHIEPASRFSHYGFRLARTIGSK